MKWPKVVSVLLWHKTSVATSFIEESDSCRLYLAESSKGRHPLGVYSGVDISAGSIIGNPEVGIPVIDWLNHNPDLADDERTESFWTAAEILAHFEYEHGDQSMIPGLGFAGSHNPSLVNAKIDHRSIFTRFYFKDRMPRGETGTLDYRRHPGAGASTEYFNITMISTVHIKAGVEIFPAYGDEYDETQSGKNNEIRMVDYEIADRSLNQFADLVEKQINVVSSESKNALWDLLLNEVITSEKLLSLLPDSAEEAERVAKIGTVVENNKSSFRSLQWLKENGQCMDNIIVAPSTIPQAGRGAFATRYIPKGSLVAPGPLVRFSRKQLHLYDYDADDENVDEGFVVGDQLLLNYCFGHPKSSVLLYPYSSATNMINHSADSPNVEIRWSGSSSHENSLLTINIGALEKNSAYGLMFDFFATRDILPGDEVFIDYGEDWEEAWNDHVQNWTPVSKKESDPTASALNEIGAPLRTVKEQEDEPYPENVQLLCSYFFHEESVEMDDERKLNLGILSDADKDVVSMHLWTHNKDAQDYTCDIVSRYILSDEQLYVARVKLQEKMYQFVADIPRSAFLFVDLPYTSAMHNENVFRHPIGIPDDMFPVSWIDHVASE